MEIDRKKANAKALEETSSVQQKTKESVTRIQRTVAEAELVGTQTLEELRRHNEQTDDILEELQGVNGKLDHSKNLQGKYDHWAGNWVGLKTSRAEREAADEIVERHSHEHTRIREVFENQRFDPIAREWSPAGLVLCSDPSISCDDVLDPAEQASHANSPWQVDFSMTGVDLEGWTYARDLSKLNKTGAGDATPKWDSYVRRRKWHRVEDRSGSLDASAKVEARNEDRKVKAANSAAAARQAKGHGASAPRETGRTLASDEELDSDDATGLARVRNTDREIDASLEATGKALDHIAGTASSMRNEVVGQRGKLEQMDERVDSAIHKTVVINANLRQQLK